MHYQDNVESGGRPLAGAEIRIYAEDTNVPVGGEENFGRQVVKEVYTTILMDEVKAQPIITDSLGKFSFHANSFSQVAINVQRPGYGSTWQRFVDLSGTDYA